MDDDVALLESWREGRRSAGSLLIERHTGTLVRFFRNKVSDSVDDLVQETFLRCVEHRDRLRCPASFRAFLLKVARRELLAHYRRRSRDRARFDPLTTSAFDLDPSPSGVLMDREEQQLVAEALRRIPLKFQIVLELFYWQDVRGPMLAEILEVPEGTARSRLKRGRELLAEQLRSLAPDPAQADRACAEVDALAG